MLLAVFIFIKDAYSAIAFVQSRSTDAGNVSSATLAFNSNNAGGNLIVAGIRVGGAPTLSSIADSNGNTYKQAVAYQQTGDPHWTYIYYAMNVAAGANSVTVTLTSTAILRFAIHEYSGCNKANVLDQTKSAQADTGTTLDTTNASATSQNNELIFAMGTGGNTDTFTAGANYTIREHVGGDKLATEDRIVTAAGTYNSTMTINANDKWAISLATFIDDQSKFFQVFE